MTPMRALFSVFACFLLCLPAYAGSLQVSGPQPPRLLCSSATQVTHTGNTNETTLATCSVPAGAMGLSGVIRIRVGWVFNNSGNNRTVKVHFGGFGGTLADSFTTNSIVAAMREAMVLNRGAANSQIMTIGASTGQWAASGSVWTTNNVDTTAATTIVLTGQLTNNADTVGYDWYTIELLIP